METSSSLVRFARPTVSERKKKRQLHLIEVQSARPGLPGSSRQEEALPLSEPPSPPQNAPGCRKGGRRPSPGPRRQRPRARPRGRRRLRSRRPAKQSGRRPLAFAVVVFVVARCFSSELSRSACSREKQRKTAGGKKEEKKEGRKKQLRVTTRKSKERMESKREEVEVFFFPLSLSLSLSLSSLFSIFLFLLSFEEAFPDRFNLSPLSPPPFSLLPSLSRGRVLVCSSRGATRRGAPTSARVDRRGREEIISPSRRQVSLHLLSFQEGPVLKKKKSAPRAAAWDLAKLTPSPREGPPCRSGSFPGFESA